MISPLASSLSHPKLISAPCLVFSHLHRRCHNSCPRHLIRPCSTEIMLNHALDPLILLLAFLQTHQKKNSYSIVPHRGSSWKPFGRKATASKSTRIGSLLSQVISNDRTCPGGLQVWPPGGRGKTKRIISGQPPPLEGPKRTKRT